MDALTMTTETINSPNMDELEQRGKCSSVRWTVFWKQEDTGVSAKHAGLCFSCHQAAKLTSKLKSKEGRGPWSLAQIAPKGHFLLYLFSVII